MHSSLSLPSPSQSLPRNVHPQSTSIFSNEATTLSFSCSSTPYHKNQSFNNLQDTAHNTQTFTSIKEKTNVVHLNQEPPNVYQNSTLSKYQDSASSSSQSFSHNQFSPINKSATTSSFSCSSITPYHKNQSSNNLQDTAHNTQTFTSIKEKTNVVHLNQEPPNVYQNSTLNKYQDSASSSSQSLPHNQFSPINKSATTSSFSCSSSTLFHQQKPKRIYQNTDSLSDSSSDSLSDSDSSSQNSRESEQNNVGKGIFFGLPNGKSKH